MTIFICISWSQLEPETAGKAQICPVLLFLVNCRSAKGTTRGQCRATLTGASPDRTADRAWGWEKKTGSTTIQINKQMLLDWLRPVPTSPFKNSIPHSDLSWEMITFLQLSLYSTFLNQGYFIYKHLHILHINIRCHIGPVLSRLVQDNLRALFFHDVYFHFLLFICVCLCECMPCIYKCPSSEKKWEPSL